jgi:galactose-1-phosphate uridylyltransferase
MIYVLIVLTHVHSGATIVMQEFNSLMTCEKAAETLRKGDYWGYVLTSECVLK